MNILPSMRLRDFLSLAAFLLAQCQLAYAIAGGILAIDYGTEWMKVSLVKPGVPFDVLLNTDSKRKIQSIVAVKGEDRWIGGDAANIASRFPDATFPAVKMLLGHGPGDSQVAAYEKVYRTKLHGGAPSSKAVYYDETTAASLSNAQLRWPEEALALQFNHAKKLAKVASNGENILDTVVTVPVFFTQAERQAILDALELAGLRPLALLDDGAAVAINYAMTRAFPTGSAENHLFYDAGAGSIRATVVSFSTSEVKDKVSAKTSKNYTTAEVRGAGWDRSAGGLVMDARIRDMLEDQFVAGQGKTLEVPFSRNKRAQAKLLKEAARVKQVLSANSEAPARIEGLAEEVDFKGHVTRDAFEHACQDLKSAFAQPIHDALLAANMTMDEITSVILIGGLSRVPMVQTAIKDLVPEDKIAQNVNADEAAVMGAALYGAGISKQFRTKDIRLTGLIPYGVDASFESDSKKDGTLRTLTQTIFAANSKSGVKKTMTFRKTTDFSVAFSYKTTNRPGSPTSIAEFGIAGLTEAWANLTETEAANATVKVSVALDESTIISIASAQLVLPEVKEKASMADKLKGLLRGADKEQDAADDADGTAASAASNDTAASGTAVKRPAGPIKLQIKSSTEGYPALSEQELKDGIKRIRDLDLAEARKRSREEARNGLEAYIYKLRDDFESPAFNEASQESERVTLRKKLEEATEWMWDQGDSAPTKDLKTARSELERAAAPVTTRLKEAEGRAAAVTDLRMTLITSQVFLMTATQQLENDTASGEVSKYTEIELRSLETTIQSNEKWLEEAAKKQDNQAKNQDPVMTISELERRKREVNAQLTILQNKRPPRKPRKTSSTTSTTTIPTETASMTSQAPNTDAESSAPSSDGNARSRDEL